jgi:hypothetical protein
MANDWTGGANSYMSESGEFEPSGGYTFTRNLMTSHNNARTYSWYSENVRVDAELKIWGPHRRGKLYNWTLVAHTGYVISGVTIRTGETSSVASCKRQADTALCNSDSVSLALSRHYSKGNATTIREKDGVDIMHVFSFASGNCSMVPRGIFIVTKPDGYMWKLDNRDSCVVMTGIG